MCQNQKKLCSKEDMTQKYLYHKKIFYTIKNISGQVGAQRQAHRAGEPEPAADGHLQLDHDREPDEAGHGQLRLQRLERARGRLCLQGRLHQRAGAAARDHHAAQQDAAHCHRQRGGLQLVQL